jgi:hypothetical protein
MSGLANMALRTIRMMMLPIDHKTRKLKAKLGFFLPT